MRPFTIHDQAATEYGAQLDSIWGEWTPWLQTIERVLIDGMFDDPIESAAIFRRAQYRAHMAGEFVAGLTAPISAVDAHAALGQTLTTARDALGMLSMQAEMFDLDREVADLGLCALADTRDAFQTARGAELRAGQLQQQQHQQQQLTMLPQPPHASAQRPDGLGMTIWALASLCAILLTALLVQLVISSM